MLVLPDEYAAKNRVTYNVLHLRNILFDIHSYFIAVKKYGLHRKHIYLFFVLNGEAIVLLQ